MAKRDVGRGEIWERRVAEQEGSGKSVRAWCRENEVAEHSFYSWRRRLVPAAPVSFALVETQGSTVAATGLLELVLRHGERLLIPKEESTLRLVLGLLQER